VLDSTECPVERPYDPLIQRIFYSGKSKQHSMKYEIAVGLQDGDIKWINGGVPGSVHDLKLARYGQIKEHLLPHEFILADKAYVGESIFITPIKGTHTKLEEAINMVLNTHREVVEHTFCRIKNFHCLSQRWRHNLTLHPIVFQTICNIVNIDKHIPV